MQRQPFEALVEEAWLRIPPRFRRRIRNLAIVVEDEPGPDSLSLGRVRPGHTLLGLYHGVPLSQRGLSYGMVLPDKISLFQGPIERAARHPANIPELVYQTLWHEIAHYFGMNEQQVRAAEHKRRHVR
jgi:predicted Zn-dependent protease with MMP-like domain